MDGFDAQMAQRVWQRVQGRGPERESWEDLYQLLRVLAGRYGRLGAKKLQQEAMEDAVCLRGLGTMEGNALPRSPAPMEKRQGKRQVWEGCCHREERLARAFEALSGDARYGQIYAGLAARAERRRVRGLRMLGQL